MEPEPKWEVHDKRRVHADAATEPGETPSPETPAPDMSAPERSAPPESGTVGGTAETPAGEPAPETPAEPTQTAPADEETAGEMPPMDVYALLQTTISLLASGAWAWMGLTPSPFTGRMEPDLAQARVAIDTISLLVDQVDPRLSETERRDMQNLLSMLRVNFVQQMQKS